MKNAVFILFILAITACNNEKGKMQTSTYSSLDSTEVINRVEYIYNENFTCLNKSEAFNGEQYLSASLKNLIGSLPEDELVFDADIWTGLQDFDSFILTGIDIASFRNDSATTNVYFQAFKDKTTKVRVCLTYEEGKWYVDDIVHFVNSKEYSIREIANGY